MASPEMEYVGEDNAFDKPVDTAATEGQELVKPDDYRELTKVQTIPTKTDDGHQVDEHGSRPGSAGSAASMAQTDPETQEVINKCAIPATSEIESATDHFDLRQGKPITRPLSAGGNATHQFQWPKAAHLQTMRQGSQERLILPQQLADPPAIEAPEASVPTTELKRKDTKPQMFHNIGLPDFQGLSQLRTNYANQKRNKRSAENRRRPHIPSSVTTRPPVSNEQCNDATSVPPNAPPPPEDPATEEQPVREDANTLRHVSDRLSPPRVTKNHAKDQYQKTPRSRGHEAENRQGRDIMKRFCGYTSVTFRMVEQELQRLHAQLAEHETIQEQLQASKQDIEEEFQAALSAKDASSAAFEQQQLELTTTKNQVKTLLNFSTGLGNDLDKLRKETQKRHSGFEAEIAEETRKIASAVEKVNLRCEGLQRTLNDKDSLLTEKDDRVTQLEKALASADSHHAQALHESRSRCEDLERQLNDKDTLLTKERDQRTQLDQELASLHSSNIEALQKDVTVVRDKLQVLHSEWKSAQAGDSSSKLAEDVLADLKTAMGRRQEEIEQAATDRANVVALQERLTLSDEHVRDADSKILAAQEMEQELHAKIASLQSRLDLQEESNSGQVAEVRLDEARAELDATKYALEQSQSQLAHVKNELHELTTSKSALQQQAQTLQRDFEEAQSKVVELGKKLTLSDKHTEDCVAEARKKMNEDVKVYESELKTRAENEVQQVKNERNRFSKEAKSLQVQLKEMQSLQQQFSSCKTRCDQLAQERDTAESSIAELREKNKNAEQQIATLEDDLTTAQAQLRKEQEDHELFHAGVEKAWEAEQQRFAREKGDMRRNLKEAMETSSTWFERDRAAQTETPLEQGDFAPPSTARIARLEAPSLAELHSSSGVRSAAASGNTERPSSSAVEYRVLVSTVDDSQITLGSFFAAAESARRTSSHHTRSDNAEMLIEADELSQPLSETLGDELQAGMTPPKSRQVSKAIASQSGQTTRQVSRSLHSSSHSSSPAFVYPSSARKTMSTYHNQGNSERHRSSMANEGRALDPRIANRSTPTTSKRKAETQGEEGNKRRTSSSQTLGFGSNSNSGKGRSDAASFEGQSNMPATYVKKPGSRAQSSASTKQTRMRNLAGGNAGGGPRRVTRRASKDAEMAALFAHELEDNRGR